MKKTSGFTLIELMIVVAIIAIIAAIAIPNLLRARIQSNESSAIGNLRAIIGAETSYNSAKGVYTADFDDLTTADPPYLDGAWDGSKNGYDFALADADGDGQCFECTATPTVDGRSGERNFNTDCSGVIYNTDTAVPIGE